MESLTIELILWLQQSRGTVIELFFHFISFLGEAYVYIAILGVVYWTINKKFGEYLATTLGLSLTINNLIKGLTRLPRPYESHPEIENLRPETSSGSSFPSGHTQGFSSFLFAIANDLKQRKWWVVAIVLTGFMMLSRMYLGVHYLRDVLVGGVLGLAIAIGHGLLFNRFYDDRKALHRYYLVLLVLFLPFLFILSNNNFFQGYGIMAGLIVAASLEHAYVGFSLDRPLKVLIVRVVVGFVLLLVTLLALETLFELVGFDKGTWGYNMLDFILYFLLSLVGFYLYPLVFKRLGY
ncbi:MAG: phosphatase PAP2 family protein [Candidatus Izemoplasmataceae bacterium]